MLHVFLLQQQLFRSVPLGSCEEEGNAEESRCHTQSSADDEGKTEAIVPITLIVVIVVVVFVDMGLVNARSHECCQQIGCNSRKEANQRKVGCKVLCPWVRFEEKV